MIEHMSPEEELQAQQNEVKETLRSLSSAVLTFKQAAEALPKELLDGLTARLEYKIQLDEEFTGNLAKLIDFDRLSENIETMRDDLVKYFEAQPKELPTDIKVSNLNDLELPQHDDTFLIEALNKLAEATGAAKEIIVKAPNVEVNVDAVTIKNKKASEAIPVMLVDPATKAFYKAFAAAFPATTGPMLKDPATGDNQLTTIAAIEALRDEDDPLPVQFEGGISVDSVGIRGREGDEVTSTTNGDKEALDTEDVLKSALLPYAQILTANDAISPSTGKRIQLIWVQVLPDSDNSSSNPVTLSMTISSVLTEIYKTYAVGRTAVFTGDVDEDLVIELDNSQPVSINIQYREV